MKLSKKALAGMLSALTIAVMTAGCGEVNIGYIDETRLNEECPQIKASTEEWQKKLEELQNTTMQQLNDAAAKGATQEEIGKIQQEAQMKAADVNADGSIDVSTSGAQEALAILANLIDRKKMLESPAIMDVDTSKVALKRICAVLPISKIANIDTAMLSTVESTVKPTTFLSTEYVYTFT